MSQQENFRKEYLGIKNNTIRKFTQTDAKGRKEILDDFIDHKINLLTIEIVHSISKESFFRKVRDVTYWQGWYIITWECLNY